jgi:Zn-dependent protease
VSDRAAVPPPTRCPACGTELAAGLLSCPSCRRLVHGARLKALAADAAAAEAAGDVRGALEHWRAALDLLPAESTQHRRILATVSALSDRLDREGPGRPAASPARRAAGPAKGLGAAGAGLAGVALLLWKLKFVLAFLVTKGKLLLLGLTKSGTLLSMLLSFGVYWTAWGWPFALGLVLSIYVHEMGHVVALTRFGIKASAPMFLPGIGAVVRMHQYPATPREDARVGLAGPIWGLGAALAAWGLYGVFHAPVLAAIAQVGAWINLFNLLPVWQLDGGRGFRALARRERWFVAAALAAAWVLTEESLLVLLLIGAVVRAAGGKGPDRSDRRTLVEFLVLVAALSAMTLVPVPGVAR